MSAAVDPDDVPLESKINFTASQGEFVCSSESEHDGQCYYTCNDIAIKYGFELTNCSTNNPNDSLATKECQPMYPYFINIYVSRGDCDRFPHPTQAADDGTNEAWIWIFSVAFVLFMLILGWLCIDFDDKKRKYSC